MNTLITAILLILASPCFGSTTLIQRVDVNEGGKPFYVTGLITPKLEVWAMGVEKANPTIEIGRLMPVKNSTIKLIGGYFSRWGNGKLFLEPFACFGQMVGNVKVSGAVFGYLPLDGGPTVFGSPQIAATIAVANHASIGIATSFWKEPGKPCPMTWGPLLEVSGGNTNISVRYTPWGNGAPNLRVQVSQSF